MKKYGFLLFLFQTLLVNAQSPAKREKLLEQMTLAIDSGKYPGMHSILISKNGHLNYEQYFNGFNRDSLHDSRSAFKSVTSLLTGIALDKGFLKSVHQKVYSFFPDYPSGKEAGFRQSMTIKNLLEMKSGFDCEEFNGTKDCEQAMETSKDWLKFSLGLPLKDRPGTVWSYTSINPMIISGIIHKASHIRVADFAKKYLFGPLGIKKYRWSYDPSGNAMTGGSFFIRPVDMVKLGQLVLNEGKWEQRQLISKKWLQESTKGNIPIPDFSFAKSSRSKMLLPQPTYYGYYWYHELLKTNAIEQDLLFASGNGGQYIFISRKLQLVVVFTQGNYGNWKAKQAFEILAKYILPGLTPE